MHSGTEVTHLVARLRAAGCVYAEDEAALLAAAAAGSELERMVTERESGVPLEHILGWAEFCGLRVRVDRGVFIPRHRTEFLVERAVHKAKSGDLLLDLCCGSGAIPLAVAASVARLEINATDIDPTAVANAAANLEGLGGVVVQGDLYESVPADARGRVDILTLVAPYVPTADLRLLPHVARDHEPVLALDGGVDGLAVVIRAIDGAQDWLSDDGVMLIEVSDRQAPIVRDYSVDSGFAARIDTDDDSGATVLILSRA